MEEKITFSEVAQLLGFQVLKRKGRNTFCVCPACGDKRQKFAYSLEKNTCNCYVCGFSGSPVKAYMQLAPKSYEDNRKGFLEALNDIKEVLGKGERQEIKPQYKPIPREEEVHEAVRREDEYISKVYKAFLSLLKLHPRHKEDLLNRGFTEEQIEFYGFKSAPADMGAVVATLQKEFSLEGVPGFFVKKSGKWTMRYLGAGYYCPVYFNNLIVGFQLRVDKPMDGTKYIWFSSMEKELGCSSGARTTVLRATNDAERYVVIEGILKATLCYELLGKAVTVIGVAGVNSIAPLNEILDGVGENAKVFEAYDMDKCLFPDASEKDIKKQKKIEKSRNNLICLFKKKGLAWSSLSWDKTDKLWNGEVKGFDDYLYSLTPDGINFVKSKLLA